MLDFLANVWLQRHRRSKEIVHLLYQHAGRFASYSDENHLAQRHRCLVTRCNFHYSHCATGASSPKCLFGWSGWKHQETAQTQLLLFGDRRFWKMPSRSAWHCWQRLFNPPELWNLLTCNLKLMTAIRRVLQQDAITGASLDDLLISVLGKWAAPMCTSPGQLSPCSEQSPQDHQPCSRGWHGGTQGRQAIPICCIGETQPPPVLSLTEKSAWEQQTHYLPLLSQSQLLHQKRRRIKMLTNCPLHSPKLSSRAGTGQKSFPITQSWTHEALLPWTGSGKYWIWPGKPIYL